MIKEEKKIYIEALRIICIFCVIFNHTKTNGFFLFSVAITSPFYWFYMFISVACKVAVPVFFMIGGALLLEKEESYKDLYKKRVLKFIIILIGISLFYYIYLGYRRGSIMNLTDFARSLYSTNISVALWYLYSYIGFLVMLPLLRKMVKAMETKDYVYLAAASVIISGVIPILSFLLNGSTIELNRNFSVPILTVSSIIYPIMGYFFEKILDKKYYTGKIALYLILLSICCIAISCFMTQLNASITGELSEDASQIFHNKLIMIPSFTVYFCLKLFFMNINLNKHLEQILIFVGSTTFGIYLFEAVLRYQLDFVLNYLKSFMPTLLACIIYVSVCVGTGCILVGLLKKIPVLKNWL